MLKRAAEIISLQNQIDQIKSVSDTKKTKNPSDKYDKEDYEPRRKSARLAASSGKKNVMWGEALFCDEGVVIAMLKRENELRLSQSVQKRFEDAERSGSKTDWIEVAEQIQLEVLREFNVSPKALNAYRCAANDHDISLYVKYNRARKGDLEVGSKAPDVDLIQLENDGNTRAHSIVEMQRAGRPLVIVAGSISWPPARYLVPAIYHDFAQAGAHFSQDNDFAFVYIEEAHATDEWPISSSRYTPDNEIVDVKQPKLASQRVDLAKRFSKTFGLGSNMKVLVDNPELGNPFEAAYGEFVILLPTTLLLH